MRLSELVGDWSHYGSAAFDSYFDVTLPALRASLESGNFVKPSNPFQPFQEVSFLNLKAVIMTSYPVTNDVLSTGRALDNRKVEAVSAEPGLRNFLKAIEAEAGKTSKAFSNNSSFLEHLPPQGVLIIPSILTSNGNQPDAHLELWDGFTTKIVECIDRSKQNVLWYLLGSRPRFFQSKITNTSHYVVTDAYPVKRGKQRFGRTGSIKEFSEKFLGMHNKNIVW